MAGLDEWGVEGLRGIRNVMAQLTPLYSDLQRRLHFSCVVPGAYPEFLERLKLCSEKKANFDPMKEIAFQRPLGPECITYVDIIGGRARLDEIGY